MLLFSAITAGFGATIAASSAVAAENEFATHAEQGIMQGFPPPPEEKRVDRSNALLGVPYNRWSYQNMRSLYPTANIPTANQPVTINRKIDGGIDTLKVKRENGEVADMPTWLRESYTDSLVVIQGDKIVWERYLNGMNANSAHQMMSVTKSFAGLFGLMAVSDGLLSEDDPVTKYVHEIYNHALTAAGVCITPCRRTARLPDRVQGAAFRLQLDGCLQGIDHHQQAR